jgi:hypothetical protein
MTIGGIETLTGGTGTDIVVLNDAGSTLVASGVEYLIGGAAMDVVALGVAGTLVTRGVETIAGSSGADTILLGDSTNTLTVAGVETLVGGVSADTVTVAAGAIRFEGGAGADVVTLAAGQAGDRVVFRSLGDSGGPGNTAGYDRIANFGAGDAVVVAGQMAGFVDRNANGTLQAAVRNTNQVNLATDEAVVLSAAVASLTDEGFTSLRAGVGKMAGGAAGTSALAVASDGVNAGVYLITDGDGDGWLAANEVRLLGVFGAAGIGVSQLLVG